MGKNRNKNGSPALIVLIAVIIVGAVSMAPLKKWSSGMLKDFNLVSDIMHDSLLVEDDEEDTVSLPDIDPALLLAMKSDTVKPKRKMVMGPDSLFIEEEEEDEVVTPPEYPPSPPWSRQYPSSPPPPCAAASSPADAPARSEPPPSAPPAAGQK